MPKKVKDTGEYKTDAQIVAAKIKQKTEEINRLVEELYLIDKTIAVEFSGGKDMQFLKVKISEEII